MSKEVRMLSIGIPSTLGNWFDLSNRFFGEDSKATAFIKEKLDEQGPDEEVVADEGQMLLLLTNLHSGGAKG